MTALVADLTSAIHDVAGRYSALDNVMKFIAEDAVYLAVLVFVVLWFRRDGLRGGLAAGLGALLALGISAVISGAHYSARPFVADHYTPLFAHSDDASFPSDHLAALGAITAGGWLSSRVLGYTTAVLAVAVGFARVYAGVHYVSDVIVGFLIGVAAATFVWYAVRPVMPLVDRLDGELRRRRLRPPGSA